MNDLQEKLIFDAGVEFGESLKDKEIAELQAHVERLRIDYAILREMFSTIRCELHEWDIAPDDAGAVEFMKSHEMTVAIGRDDSADKLLAHIRNEVREECAHIVQMNGVGIKGNTYFYRGDQAAAIRATIEDDYESILF